MRKRTSPISRSPVPAIELIAVLSLAALVMACFFCVWQSLAQSIAPDTVGGRSGEKLFKTFLLDPIPESVVILQSQDEAIFRDYVLLHFKISPKDFDLILETKKWETNSSSSDYENVSWWNPDSLGEDAICYSVSYMVYGNGDSFRFEKICTNLQRNEVFFELVFVG